MRYLPENQALIGLRSSVAAKSMIAVFLLGDTFLSGNLSGGKMSPCFYGFPLAFIPSEARDGNDRLKQS